MVEYAGVDEWLVENVEGHRRNKQGEVEFLVRWEGIKELTWEPLQHFFHLYSQPLVDY